MSTTPSTRTSASPADRQGLYDRVRARTGPTKYCSACGADHELEDFGFKDLTTGALQSRCRASLRDLGRQRHAGADGDAQRARVAARKHAQRTEVNGVVERWLSEDVRRCARCGARHRLIAVGPTGGSLKRLLKQGWSPEAITRALGEAKVSCRSCQNKL